MAPVDVLSGQRLWRQSVQLWLPPHLLVQDKFLSLLLSTVGKSVSSPPSTRRSFPLEEIRAGFRCLRARAPTSTDGGEHHARGDDLEVRILGFDPTWSHPSPPGHLLWMSTKQNLYNNSLSSDFY